VSARAEPLGVAEGLGRPIRGPSAFGDGDLRSFFYLTWTLAVTEFKLKFFGSVLGYLWQLIRPLLLFGVLYVVFTEFVRFGEGVAFFPVVLLTGIVIFSFFQEATGNAVTSVVDRENLVRKIQFPRMVIPASVVLTAYFNLALNLVAVFVFIAIQGVEVRWTWLELPVLLVLLGVFATGVAMLLSALYVRFRDVRPIWDVMLQVLFYGSPILYTLEQIPNQDLAQIMVLSPLATVLEQVRYAVIDPAAPSAAAAAGGMEWLAVPAGIGFGVLALGLWVFNREAPRIAEEL
jgi:ABC-2 type transport system permease protein